MEKITVKLKEGVGVFHDVTSNQTVVGKEATNVIPTERVRRAIRGGVLIKVDKKS